MIQFLANENFPLKSVRCLREAGHDVRSVIEDSPGVEDSEVLARATHEQRVVLTFDRDHGELIYRLGMPSPAGIVYFRYQSLTPNEPGNHLLYLLGIKELALDRRLTVVERSQVRQRPLP